MEFVNCLTEDMPCGGEVVACTENDRMYEAKFIVNKLKKMHITYLDSTHDMKALDLWKSISWDGFDNLKIWKGYSLYEYIGEHLGYRLVVRTVELKPIRRGRAEFMFEIENTGFGRVFQETELFLIMKNRNETREVPISMDMRKIQAGTRMDGSFILQIKTVQTPFTWEVCTVEKFILVKNKSTYRNCLAVFCPLIGKVDRIFCVWIFHTQ